ncbi:MAG TPA: DMT family transporter [Candidatus Dojkabacteria bacterium]|mgnify:FL=1|nr:DMT family transporter [Candidatus Dojkabacteria bacterium]
MKSLQILVARDKINKNTMNIKPNYQKAYILLLITSILWGIAPAIIKTGINQINPIVFLFYRYLIASIPVLIYIIYSKNLISSIKIIKSPKNILTMLCITPLPLILIFSGMKYTTSIIASVAGAFSPIVATVMGAHFMKEKITKNEKIGTIIAFTGISLLSIIEQETNSVPMYQQILGVLLIMSNSFIWIWGGILYKKSNPKERDLLNLNSFLISVPLFILIIFIANIPLNIDSISTSAWNSIFYMAILGTLVAFTTYQKAIEIIEVSEANLFGYINPVFAIPAGIIIAGETLNLSMIIPLIIIAIGIFIAIKEKMNIK